MWKSDWDYNSETDKLPKNITILILVASIVRPFISPWYWYSAG